MGGHGGDRLFRALWAIVRTWLLCREKLGVTGGFRAKSGWDLTCVLLKNYLLPADKVHPQECPDGLLPVAQRPDSPLPAICAPRAAAPPGLAHL